ncbi:hypothetical protein Cgig2_011566 [Carnegiea gigantea]|uniref:Uncharacterized protein n=1 Tax=Carnegiea gigantea TaxID=171969 RepID=A0A9Q1JIP5_9CARY|nr:hypothetical protein Cgig2_011566 [Carnegiea gigantea]
MLSYLGTSNKHNCANPNLHTKSSLLDFDYNRLYGAIPLAMGKLKSLGGKNNFRGTFPSIICNFSMLSFLRLSGNEITGQIPDCIGNLGSLQTLSLAYNLSCSSELPQERLDMSDVAAKLSSIKNKLLGTLLRQLRGNPIGNFPSPNALSLEMTLSQS